MPDQEFGVSLQRSNHGTPSATALVNLESSAALLQEVKADLAGGKGFAIATLNLDHLVKLHRSENFRAAYSQQDYVVADGNPVVWLCRLAGRSVDLVPGSELVVPLSALAASLNAPVALVGSTPEALGRAAERLEQDHPGLRFVARISPPMGFDPEGPAAEACFAELEAAGVRLCFLALGAPKQEILAARGRQRLPGCGFASVGAGIDFIAGTQKRAPRWVRAMAMEWLWRAAGNPRRLARRYLDCGLILPGLAWRAWRRRN